MERRTFLKACLAAALALIPTPGYPVAELAPEGLDEGLDIWELNQILKEIYAPAIREQLDRSAVFYHTVRYKRDGS